MRGLRFVLMGTGNIAGTYVAAAEKLEGVDIVAVVSRDAERARAFADERGITESGTSLEALSCDFDAVFAATPNGAHHTAAVAAAAMGKHALVEKPLDVSAENMDAMIRACREAGVKLGATYQKRTRENNLTIKRLLDEKAFGRIYAVDLILKFYRGQDYYDSAAWRGTRALDGGGPFMQQGSHDIDVFGWFFGLPARVFARTGRFAHTGIEVEDHGAASLLMRDGAIATITASTIARPGFPGRMDVFAERGSFSLANDAIVQWDVDGMENPGVPIPEDAHSTASVSVTDTSGHETIIRDFVEAVHEDRDPFVSGAEGRRATDIILAVYRSAEEGREVTLA